MMQSYREHNIQELPLSSPYFCHLVERFLGENGLRLEAVDVYCAIEDDSGHILAGAGLSGDIIKCIAVAAQARSEGLVAPLVSHIISLAAARGITELKLFTKPENQAIFESLGFRVIARAPKAILMENGRGLERYCAYLKGFAREGRNGVVVMNANPFTLGHLYLLQQASRQVDTLYVIPVKEDRSQFPYTERASMIQMAVENYFSQGFAKNQFPTALNNQEVSVCVGSVKSEEKWFFGYRPEKYFSSGSEATDAGKMVVLEGSDYQISAATFPTYFLKDLSDASETQMRLDLDLFARHIAPALNATVRFVGSEPSDPLTARYNELMAELFPEVIVIPRVTASASIGSVKSEDAVSASAVRKALEEGSLRRASALCPETSWPYLLAALAERALRMELDTPGKPGLVGPDSCGAHKDMDYSTMLSGIRALRPFWSRMALASSPEALRQLGIEAEEAMLQATGGVNTHRGAIFCMGLALYAWAQGANNEKLMQSSLGEIARRIFDNNQTINHLAPRAAMANALSGYRELFEDWLPFYREEGSLQRLLLRIMSTLDDTCVIKRVGYERAQEVKREAAAASDLKALCARYAQEGVSPGGAADMLALTIFIHSIIS